MDSNQVQSAAQSLKFSTSDIKSSNEHDMACSNSMISTLVSNSVKVVSESEIDFKSISRFNLTDYGPCKIVDWLCNWPVQCSVTSPQYFTWACYLENWLTETWKEWCKAGTLLFIDVAAQFRNLLWLTENESTGNDYFAQSVSNRSAQPTELSQSQHICCMAHHSTLGDQHTQNINCQADCDLWPVSV